MGMDAVCTDAIGSQLILLEELLEHTKSIKT
jgi:hypothetical protein